MLFLGDYDLTKFGPWYGDRESSIEDTIKSVDRLRQIKANVLTLGHETGVFYDDTPDKVCGNYLGGIYERERKLLDFLIKPRTMEEIVNAWIVYHKSREPRELFPFGEKANLSKHLNLLIEK